jgi:chromosome segregation protein
MYLKSIDIVGYKSFALKTRVDLEPGITGIIGPNGCGKSNIMESVRWCLGEMSWKSLRADHMTDVIFSGTAKRPPLSMTEVTLTFDNSSQLLPVQFSEVTVTRRIYRSGESAYFLNKTQCRLRDIREMFLDTGLGGDGYAIIDQGGVDGMIKAKPEERRAFFEEAAGVAKYNSKREEALRKLERVEMDMGRLQDSVSLINEQVKKLDSDARKAKLYEKYKEELVSAEAAHILQQVSVLQRELESLDTQVKPLEETLGSKRAEMSGEGANLAAHNLEKANQQNQVIECNQKISAVKSEMGRLEERIHSAQTVLEDAEQRSAACQSELDGMRQRVEAIVPESDRAAAAAAEAQSSLDASQAEASGWHAQLDTLRAKLSEAEQGLDRLRRECLQAADAALAQRRRVSDAESSWSRQEMQVRGSLRELDKDLAQAAVCEADIAPARAALETQRLSVEAARTELSAAEEAVSGLRAKQAELSDETMRLHTELAQHNARAESLEAQGGQNPYWVGAQTVLNAGLPGIIGTVRQLFKVEDAYKHYFEDLLGERLYAIVCEDSSAAKAAVELLDASSKGRARFLVLSSLPGEVADRGYPEEAKPLLAHVQFDPAHEKAVRFLLSETYALGKVLFGSHWVYGGSVEKESLQLNLADVQEIKAKATACRTRTEELSLLRQNCAQDIAAAEQRVKQAAAQTNAETGREHSLVAQISEKESSLNLYARNAELSTSEAARVLAEMALTKETIKSLLSGIDETARAESEARQRESEAAGAFGVLREELARGQATQDLLQSKLQSAQEKVSFLTGAYERLVEEKTTLEAAAERRSQELTELARKKQDAVAGAAESRQRLDTLAVELAARENEANAVFERLRELEQQITQREAAIRALTQACNEAQEQLHGLELKVSGQRGTQDALKKRLWDEWQITVEEAANKYKDVEVNPERIEFLRKRIVALGNVNMAAPEEYLTLSEKQVFLANQIEDLKKAKEDLMAAITKINSATRENFRDTFTNVREHFRRLYGVLFEGGEADLVLTDPENMLETGVEIVAQPPGKRLQSISLLSGGEKTLTAIALLFAFFLVKPSPFCMLDEADAALDDANVERFVALLKEFQARSQFIIVSHNKRTMEAADVIYGVTMEEMGVSQLVSVDFSGKKKEVKKIHTGEQETIAGPTTHGPFSRQRFAGPETPPASGGAAVAEPETPVVETVTETTIEIVAETPVAEPPAIDAPKVEPPAAADDDLAQG